MPFTSHHRRSNFWHHYKELAQNKELIEIYISMIIRTLSFSMIGIFVPIYLISKIGMSVTDTLLFFTIWSLGMILFYPLAAKIASKIGMKHTMLLSAPVYILYFILLILMQYYKLPYVPIALVSSLANALFWMAFHTHFAKSSNSKSRGEQTSITFAIILSAGILGPLMGGIIITYFGFITQFALSGVLLLLSTVPLFFTKDSTEKPDLRAKYIFQKEHRKDFVRAILVGVRTFTESIIWPIILFQTLKTVLDLGAISSGAALIATISAIIVGKISDKYRKRDLMKIGGLLDAIIWPIRLFFTSAIGLFTITSLGGMVYKLVDIPYDARNYNKAARGNIMGYMIMREVGIGIGRTLIMVLAITISLKGSIYSTALISLIHAFI